MERAAAESTPEEVFSGPPRGLALFRAVEELLAHPVPPEIRATRSPVAFRENRGLAYVWWPGRYVRSDVPAVLSIATGSRIDSSRFKSVVSPSPGVWMHHLELRSEDDLGAEVAGWLQRARDEAR